jgi:hypothetical protein
MTETDLWKIFIFILVIIILILLYYLLRKYPREVVGIKKPRERLGLYKGWLMTWIDAQQKFPWAVGEANMRLVYGHAIVYDDGSSESIPETFRLTYYEMYGGERKCNPALTPEIVAEYGEHQGYPVLWADGTDQFLDLMDIPKPELQQILYAMRNLGAGKILQMSLAKTG